MMIILFSLKKLYFRLISFSDDDGGEFLIKNLIFCRKC